ncbi:MAG: caspase family protein [Clostridia bacterium]|nr:caspase family protein [Clostridia bacterium]
MKRVYQRAAALAALILALQSAFAQVALPAGIRAIEAEAFLGNTALIEVQLPEGLVSIGERAFSACSNLGWIDIPASVTELNVDCLSGCASDLLIRTQENSAAMHYALTSNVDVQADTTYRALLIAQEYADLSGMTLEGPPNDVAAWQTCLPAFGETPYQLSVRTDLTAQGMEDAILDVFGSAKAQDVSLFYYSGHGIFSDDDSEQGALLGADGEETINATRLRTVLDRIQGRKIVIIDACYSGNMLVASAASEHGVVDIPTAEDFVNSFIAAFSRKKRSNLSADSYFVLTAASKDEESYEGLVNGRMMGLFTGALLRGLGLNAAISGVYPADANGNSVVTLSEAFAYARRRLIPEGQHIQAYPENCDWFGFMRADHATD